MVGHLRQMLLHCRQALAESFVIPATQPHEGKDFIQSQSLKNLSEAFFQSEKIIRPEFFDRFSVSLARFYEVARPIAKHEGGDVEGFRWASRVQHLSAQVAAILSDDLIINHHRERSMESEGRYSTSELQRSI